MTPPQSPQRRHRPAGGRDPLPHDPSRPFFQFESDICAYQKAPRIFNAVSQIGTTMMATMIVMKRQFIRSQ